MSSVLYWTHSSFYCPQNEIATYNSKGYLTSLTTPNSGTYTIAYDNFGNTSSIKAGSFTLAQYVYNANNGKLNKTTYGNGFYTENVYDELDRIIQIKYNGVVKYSFKYNGDGQLYSATDVPNNTITYYEYDSNGRLLRAKLKENTSTGSVLLNTENKFDDLGRAVKSVYDLPKLGETMVYTVTYKGNSTVTSGRIENFGLPNGKSIFYGYDKFDRITSKSMSLTASTGLAEHYSYWTSGNKTANLVTTHTLTTPGGSIAYNYTYDDYGNILTMSEGSTLKLSYTYDDLNQLTRENNAYANKTYVYTYDKNGNILTKKTYAYTTGTLGSVQNTVNYTYGNSSWKDLLTNYNGTAISYDGSGNPINWRGSITSLTWNGRQLNTLRYGSNTYTYTYNSDGIRTQKALVTDGVYMTLTTHYVLDGTNVVAQYQTATNTMDLMNVMYFYYDEAGSPTGIKYNGNVYYFQKNLQGDIIRILNTYGSIVATYTYDAWGNIISSTDTSGVSIGTKNPFRYRGYYYDTETGLYYLNSRYYDPQVGRFLNADGFVSTGQGLLGSNMFAYCGNNPAIKIDNRGYIPVDIFQRKLDPFIMGADSSSNMIIALSSSLAPCGEPNSVQILYNPDGTPKQVRWYGADGKAIRDRDYNHGGNHKFPHDHEWKDGKRIENHLDPSPEYPDPSPEDLGPPSEENEPSSEETDSMQRHNSSLEPYIGVGEIIVGTLVVIYILGNDATIVGILDDFLLGPSGAVIADGLAKVGG